MQLQAQHAVQQSQRRVVGKVKDQSAVQIVAHVVALGYDHDIVPVVEFEKRLERLAVDQ